MMQPATARRWIERLTHELRSAAGEVRAMGCTCSDMETINRVHAGSRTNSSCTGHNQAVLYERFASVAERALKED